MTAPQATKGWTLSFAVLCLATGALADLAMRPPSVPLFAMDPYMSLWSPADNLTDAWSTHWTNQVMAMAGLVRVDGKALRFMGPASMCDGCPEAMQQVALDVGATATTYKFEGEGIALSVTFQSPVLNLDDDQDLELFSRPASYISFSAQSTDGANHDVDFYFDHTSEFVVKDVSEKVSWNRGVTALKDGRKAEWMSMGNSAQNVLGDKGDFVRINWGYSYLSVVHGDHSSLKTYLGGVNEARSAFTKNGCDGLPETDDTDQPRACSDRWPGAVAGWKVEVTPSASTPVNLVFAYDDILSIDYFGDKMKPYWARDGKTIQEVIVDAWEAIDVVSDMAAREDKVLEAQVAKLDESDQAKAQYLSLLKLVWRQGLGGGKVVWNDAKQEPWYFVKEMSSNGDLSTVDVIFPASPIFLTRAPKLLELYMKPILSYANNETSIKYNLPWAPHHLGTYPIADIGPSEQEQMPVEESGNMMLMLSSLVEKLNGDMEWLKPYMPLLQTWANYLVETSLDPGDQLCTDDFMGPSPHNANLAAKGIVGLGAYSQILQRAGEADKAAHYMSVANEYAVKWMSLADASDHYRLEYDKPDSWSLKYNLVWQNVLGLDIFPTSVVEKEVSYYLNHQRNTYGVPLDVRATFTKADWESWVAAMAPKSSQGFEKLIADLVKFVNETPDRVAFSDWYFTDSAKQKGFQARIVMGAMYIKLLTPPQAEYMPVVTSQQ